MLKEINICIIIVIMIIFGNNITQKYTNESVGEMENLLNNTRNEIAKDKENIDVEKLEKEVDEIDKEWEKRHEKLAYFIEHDELEKVETNLTALRGNLEAKEYGDAMSQLDQSVFLLKHIEDKYAFNLQNIF